MIVIDASVTLAWCLKDEASEYADSVLKRVSSEGGLVPAHWPLEVANGLLVAERRGRIRAKVVDDLGRTLSELAIEIQQVELSTAFWGLATAREYKLSEYDAVYLELSRARGLALATLDEPLRAASRRAGVEIVD